MTCSAKKSWALNNRRIAGVVMNLQIGKPNSILVTSLNVVSTADIIFWASESGDNAGLKQPRRVFKATTATATFQLNWLKIKWITLTFYKFTF